MALFNIQQTTLTADGAGSHSTSHDAGSSPTWMVIGVAGGANDYSTPSSLTYGGVSLTGPLNSVRYGWVGGYGDVRTMMYYKVGGVPSGSNTLAVTWGGTAPTTGRVHIWTGRSKGTVTLADNGQDSGLNTTHGNVLLDAGTKTGNGFYAGGSNAAVSADYLQCDNDYSFNVDGNSNGGFGSEPAGDGASGSRQIGWSGGVITAGNISGLIMSDSKDGAVAEPPSVGSGYKSLVLGKAPQSYWRLHEASGAYVDIVGAIDGTGSGTITREVTGNFTWESSLQKNLGIGLSTSAGSISVGDVYDFTSAASYTIMAWVSPLAVQGTGDHYIVSKLDGSGYGWALGVQGSDDSPADALFSERASATGTDRLEADVVGGIVSPYSNEWYCVMVTYDEDSNTHRLYFNGTIVRASISTITDIPDHATAMLIGSTAGATNFNGNVDEVAVWDRALTRREVWELYYLGSTQQRAKEKETYRDLTNTHFPTFYHRLNDANEQTGLEVGVLRAERDLDHGLPTIGSGYEFGGYNHAPYPETTVLNLIPNGTFDSSLGGWTESDPTSSSWQSDGGGGGYLEIIGDGAGTEDVDNDVRVQTGIHTTYEVSVDLYSTVADEAVFSLVRYDSTGAEIETVDFTGPVTPSSWETTLDETLADVDQTDTIGFRCSVPNNSTATSRFRNLVVVPARGRHEKAVVGPTSDRYGAGARLEYGPLPSDTLTLTNQEPRIYAVSPTHGFIDKFMQDKWPHTISLWFKMNATNPTGGGTVTAIWTNDAQEGGG